MPKKNTEELNTKDWNLKQKQKQKQVKERLASEVPKANLVVTLPEYDDDDDDDDYDPYFDYDGYYGGYDYDYDNGYYG